MTTNLFTRITDDVQFWLWASHASEPWTRTPDTIDPFQDTPTPPDTTAYAYVVPALLPKAVATTPVHYIGVPQTLMGPAAKTVVPVMEESLLSQVVSLAGTVAARGLGLFLFGFLFPTDTASPPIIAAPTEGMTLPEYFEHFQRMSELLTRVLDLQETLRHRRGQNASAEEIQSLVDALNVHLTFLSNLSQITPQSQHVDIQNSNGTESTGASQETPETPRREYKYQTLVELSRTVSSFLGVSYDPVFSIQIGYVTATSRNDRRLRVIATRPNMVLIERLQNRLFYVVWRPQLPGLAPTILIARLDLPVDAPAERAHALFKSDEIEWFLRQGVQFASPKFYGDFREPGLEGLGWGESLWDTVLSKLEKNWNEGNEELDTNTPQ